MTGEVFWQKVNKFGPVVREGIGRCWMWLGVRGSHGYGQIRFPPRFGSKITTHRFAFIQENGPIPPGMCVLHRCDNRPCVRPSHLFLGTVADNNADMARKDRSAHGMKNPSAKLSVDEVARILAEITSGAGQRATARKYGVGQGTVWDIVRGRTWKRATGVSS